MREHIYGVVRRRCRSPKHRSRAVAKTDHRDTGTSRFDLDASRYKSLLSTFSSFAVRGKKGNVACGSRFTGVQQRVETRAQVAAYAFGGINQV